MKILVVTTLAGPGAVAGGVWSVALNQARSLQAAGHRVSIVAGWLGTPPPPDKLVDVPLKFVSVRPVVRQAGLRFLVGKGWAQAIRQAAIGADVAHVHLCRDFLTTQATLILKQLGIPVVAQCHGMLSPSTSIAMNVFDACWTRRALRKCKQFITLTDEEQPQLETLGVPRTKTTTIPNTTPDPHLRWHSQPGHGRRQRLLFISRLHPRKQPEVFAESLQRLRAEGWDVEGHLYGPDEGALATVQPWIASSSGTIRYHGSGTRRMLDEALASADIFVFPPRQEPFGLVLIEALAVGIPTVCTSDTPIASILHDADASVIVEPTAQAVTGACSALLSDPDRAKAIGDNGHALWLAKWSDNALPSQLELVYANAGAS